MEAAFPLNAKSENLKIHAQFLNGHVFHLQKRIYWIQKLTHIPEEEVTL